MSVDLPYDVWLQIGEFLTPAQRRSLLSVNRAFLDLALNGHYRELVLYNLDERQHHILERLQDTYIASRVRKLRVVPGGLFSSPSPLESRVDEVKRAAAKLGLFKLPVNLKFGTPDQLAQKLASVFESVQGLVELELDYWYNASLSKTAYSIVSSACSIVGPRLHTLTLDISLSAISQTLSSSMTFGSLKVLILHIPILRDFSQSQATEIITSQLLPFVNNHKPTLKTFILAAKGSGAGDISPLLLGMGYFPLLTKINVSVKTSKGARGVWRVIGLHADRLEEIIIARHALIDVSLYTGPPLLRLKSFNLTMSIPLEEPSGFAHLKFLGNGITSLYLNDYTYRYTGVSNILETLEANTMLQVLSMQFDTLSPQVIDLFSRKAPHLRELRLSVDFCAVLGRASKDIKTRERDFCREISERQYQDWNIQKIDVKFTGMASAECENALRRVLPQAQVQFRINPIYHVIRYDT